MNALRRLPPGLLSDILKATEAAVTGYGMVNVPLLAEQVRSMNAGLNIALEDIQYEIIRISRQLNVSMEFDQVMAPATPQVSRPN